MPLLPVSAWHMSELGKRLRLSLWTWLERGTLWARYGIHHSLTTIYIEHRGDLGFLPQHHLQNKGKHGSKHSSILELLLWQCLPLDLTENHKSILLFALNSRNHTKVAKKSHSWNLYKRWWVQVCPSDFTHKCIMLQWESQLQTYNSAFPSTLPQTILGFKYSKLNNISHVMHI